MKPLRRVLAVLLSVVLLAVACDFERQVLNSDPDLWLRFGEPAPPFIDVVDDRAAQVDGSESALFETGVPSGLEGGDGVGISKTAAGDARLVLDDGQLDAGELAAAGGVTVEAWYGPADDESTTEIVSRGDGVGQVDWRLSQVEGEYRWEVFDASGSPAWSVTAGSVTPGATQQVVGVFDTSGAAPEGRLYVNNVEAGSTGEIEGDPRNPDVLGLRIAEGGPFAVLSEVIVFERALSVDAIRNHWIGGTTPDPCDVLVGWYTPVGEPEVLLDTASDVGGPTLVAGEPRVLPVGAVAGVALEDLDAVMLEVTPGADGASLHIWPQGWERPAAPLVPDAVAGVTSRVPAQVGEATGIVIESDVATDLHVAVVGYWRGGELRAAGPGTVFDGPVEVGEDQSVVPGGLTPTRATAVLLGVTVDSDGEAGELAVPDPAEPDLGGEIVTPFGTAPSTVTVLARLDGGETSIRSTVDASLRVQVLGWATNPDCAAHDQIPPSIAIEEPLDGAVIDADDFTFEMAGVASDAHTGVKRIELAVDGEVIELLEPRLTGPPNTWSVEHSVPEGTWNLTATAYDFKGNTATDEITVTVGVPDEEETVLAPEVIEPDVELADAIVSFDPEAGILVVADGPSIAAQVLPGTVLIADPIDPIAPDGLIHRIIKARLVDGQWRLDVVPAPLIEVFRQLSVVATVYAYPDDAAGPSGMQRSPEATIEIDVKDKCDDPDASAKVCITLDGELILRLDFELDIGWDWGWSPGPRLRYAKLFPNLELNLDAGLEATAAKEWKPDPIEVRSLNLPTIPVWGPVVLRPRTELNLILEAKAEAKIEVGLVGMGLDAGVGVEYDDGLQLLTEFDPRMPELTFPNEGITSSAGLQFKAAPRVDLDVLVNGVAGPQIWVKPVELELNLGVEHTAHPDPIDDVTAAILTAELHWLKAGLDLEIDLIVIGWEIEGFTGQFGPTTDLVDIQIDLVRGCEVGECGHKVLPKHPDWDDAEVSAVSPGGTAVGSLSRFGTGFEQVPATWDAKESAPQAQALPIDGWTRGWGRAVSPSGSMVAGGVFSASPPSVSPARWSVGTSPSAPDTPPAWDGPGGWGVPCAVNNSGDVLLAGSAGLALWSSSGHTQILGMDTSFAGVSNFPCDAALLSDGRVVANVPTDFGWGVYVWSDGPGAQLIGPGVFRSVGSGGAVVGYTFEEDGDLSAVLWNVSEPGEGPTWLAVGGFGLEAVAEGIDSSGNVYGVVLEEGEVRNHLWRHRDDGGYDWVPLGSQMDILGVSSAGWMFGLDLSEDAPVYQWHESWFLPFLGGQGRLGSFGSDQAERTVYFGRGGLDWHRGITTALCPWPPSFPIPVGPDELGGLCE